MGLAPLRLGVEDREQPLPQLYQEAELLMLPVFDLFRGHHPLYLGTVAAQVGGVANDCPRVAQQLLDPLPP